MSFSIATPTIHTFDILFAEKQVLEITKVLTGDQLVTKILDRVIKSGYDDYCNSRLGFITIIFRNKNDATNVYKSLLSKDLKSKYDSNAFYSTLQECILLNGILHFGLVTDLVNVQDQVLFEPLLTDNKISVYIPNKNILLIQLIPNISKSGIKLKSSEIFNSGISITASLLTHKRNYLLMPNIIECSDIKGERCGLFLLRDGNLYLISDIAFNILNIVTGIHNQVLNLNNLDKLDKYIKAHANDWEQFKLDLF